MPWYYVVFLLFLLLLLQGSRGALPWRQRKANSILKDFHHDFYYCATNLIRTEEVHVLRVRGSPTIHNRRAENDVYFQHPTQSSVL